MARAAWTSHAHVIWKGAISFGLVHVPVAREHLAALIADGDALILNTIRWANEIRSRDDIELAAAARPCARKAS